MAQEKRKFRIVAESTARSGDLIVEDPAGEPHLFVGATGTLSRGRLNDDFVAALLKSENWHHVRLDRVFTVEDLRQEFAGSAR